MLGIKTRVGLTQLVAPQAFDPEVVGSRLSIGWCKNCKIELLQ